MYGSICLVLFLPPTASGFVVTPSLTFFENQNSESSPNLSLLFACHYEMLLQVPHSSTSSSTTQSYWYCY